MAAVVDVDEIKAAHSQKRVKEPKKEPKKKEIEVLSEKDARKAIYQQLQIASEESFEEKQLKQELEKIRAARLNVQVELQKLVASCSDSSHGIGDVGLGQPTVPNEILEVFEEAETLAIEFLQKLLASPTTGHIHESIAREVTSALGLLANTDRSTVASADALLAMGRAVAACPPDDRSTVASADALLAMGRAVAALPKQKKLLKHVENKVRDVVVWRCQIRARKMDSRVLFQHVLKYAFGGIFDDLDNDSWASALYSRVMHAHRKVVADPVSKSATSWISNSQRAAIKKHRTRPKRERYTNEDKEEDDKGAEGEGVYVGEKGANESSDDNVELVDV